MIKNNGIDEENDDANCSKDNGDYGDDDGDDDDVYNNN